MTQDRLQSILQFVGSLHNYYYLVLSFSELLFLFKSVVKPAASAPANLSYFLSS